MIHTKYDTSLKIKQKDILVTVGKMGIAKRSVETQKFDAEAYYTRMDKFFDELGSRYATGKPTIIQFLEDALSVIAVAAGGAAASLTEYSNVLNLWLYEHGWPPILHPDLRKIPFLHLAVEGEVSEATQIIVDEGIVSIHTNKIIRKIYLGWCGRPYLASRLPILKQVIDAHIRGDYGLTTPALLAQLEGFVVEKTGHSGRLDGKGYKALLDRSLPEHEVLNIDDAVYQLIVEKVLCQFEHGSKPSFDMSRNAILHGADLDYATKKTSLKAILLFDFVSLFLTDE